MRTAALAVMTILTLPVFAQEKREPAARNSYRVQFTIRDSAAKDTNSARRITMLIDNGGRASLRVGSKVPYVTVSGQGNAATQYQYFDQGVNIDCRLVEESGRVGIVAEFEISSVMHYDTGAPNPPNPTIGQLRAGVNASLQPGIPAVVASIDDPIAPRKFDIEAVATRVP